jgi:hypothetical protein
MNNKLLEKVGFIFLAIILFGFGFYLGQKYKPTDSKTSNIANSDNKKTDNNSPNLPETLIGKEIPEIFWIKTGSEPVCPENYPIKGRLTDGQKLYYLPETKSASRVKPDVCFLNEEYAKNKAGFIRKF